MRERFMKLAMIGLLPGLTIGYGCYAGAPSPAVLPVQIRAQVEPVASPTALPVPAQTVTNVTRQEYENARDLWLGQGVLVYEITLIDSTRMDYGGMLRLRFQMAGDEAKLISYTDLNGEQPEGSPLASLTGDEREYLEGLSVERMFRLLEKLFVEQPPHTGNLTYVYDVAFDPGLGYLTHVYSHAYLQQGGLAITECCLSYQVLSLRILQSVPPGMPKAGNPGP
jgi:hypothetical protein